jgi:hypothetical protein
LYLNLFWSNHDYWLIIVDVWYLIIVQWLISNMLMPLILLYLLGGFETHVVGFALNVLRILEFSAFDSFWSKCFVFLCFFLQVWYVLNFDLNLVFFSSQTNIFCSVYGQTKDSESTKSDQNRVIWVRLGLVINFFFIKDFWLKCVFGKHAFMSILTVFFKEKWDFTKQSLKKIINKFLRIFAKN